MQMRGQYWRTLGLIVLLCWTCPALHAQDTVQDLDWEMLSTRLPDDPPLVPEDTTDYTFLAAGHWYGSHENSLSQLPAATLYANVEYINAQRPDWIFILGDAVRDASSAVEVEEFTGFARRLQAQKQMIPGNHDLLQDHSYNDRLGATVNCRSIKRDQFIFLNTETLRFGGGKAMLQQLTDTAQTCPDGNNLFVFSHRLLWALTEPGFEEMDDFANEPFAPMVAADTLRLVYDAVLKLAGNRPLHWFSGDVGASWSENVFYDESADHQRHFYAAGLGDCRKDAFWHVRVDTAGKVSPSLFMLGAAERAQSLEEYDLAHWRKRMQERRAKGQVSFVMRAWKILRSPRFLFGLVAGCILAFGVGFILRRMQNRRK